MTALALAAALLGVASTAVSYGTDIFSALVLRPRSAAHVVPADTRKLQQHGDAVIWTRAAYRLSPLPGCSSPP